MYILLRGKVTIYINYTVKAEQEIKAETAGGDGGMTSSARDEISYGTTKKEKENIRQQLGTFVTHLGECAQSVCIWGFYGRCRHIEYD